MGIIQTMRQILTINFADDKLHVDVIHAMYKPYVVQPPIMESFRPIFFDGYLKWDHCRVSAFFVYICHFNPLLHRYLFLTHQQQTAFENIVGKEEIAPNEQFLLFPPCFLLNQKIKCPFVNIYDIILLFAAELEEPKISMSGNGSTLYRIFLFLMTLSGKAFEKHRGKRRKYPAFPPLTHNVFYPVRD